MKSPYPRKLILAILSSSTFKVQQTTDISEFVEKKDFFLARKFLPIELIGRNTIIAQLINNHRNKRCSKTPFIRNKSTKT